MYAPAKALPPGVLSAAILCLSLLAACQPKEETPEESADLREQPLVAPANPPISPDDTPAAHAKASPPGDLPGSAGTTAGASGTMDLVCDKTRLHVAFGNQQAHVTIDADQTLNLAAKPVSSGYLYSGNGYELRGKSPAAIWLVPGGKPVHCQEELSK